MKNMINLKMLRARAKETQADVARDLGVDRTTYSKYEAGSSEPSFEILDKLSKHFNVSVDFLLGSTTPSNSNAVKIPVLGDVAAGLPMMAIENIIDYEEIGAELASTGEFFGLRIKGGSMEPRIREGDVVIVRKQSEADTGDTAVILVNGSGATVKRIKKEPGGLSLIPNNPAFDIQYYSAHDVQTLPVVIVGKVVELRAKF